MTVSAAEQVASICQRLVQVPSVTGQEGPAVEECRKVMQELGFDRVWVDDWGNLIGQMGSGRGGVLFDAHIDTVGPGKAEDWTRDPFGGTREGDLIYGRGSADMKGALAAMMVAAARLKEEGFGFESPVTVSATVLEETTEGVALARVLEDIDPRLVVVGEATQLAPNLGGRGRAEIRLEAVGQSAHSSSPEEGLNALDVMVPALERIAQMELPTDDRVGRALAVVTDLWSEPRPSRSVIPHYAAAVMDRRLIAGETKESTLEGLRAHLEPAVRGRILLEGFEEAAPGDLLLTVVDEEVRTYTGRRLSGEKVAPAWISEPADPPISRVLSALREAGFDREPGYYQFCTNASMSAGVMGYPTLGLGPGTEGRAHTADEWISLEELDGAERAYRAIMSSF